MFIQKNDKSSKGVTLIELIVVLAISSLVIVTIFPMFFFGSNTYDSGRVQYDIQSNIRLATDVIRDRIRYVSDLAVMDDFDPISVDSNFNYIYLTDDKKSIKFVEGSLTPVDIINSGISDTSLDLVFTKGSTTGNAIRFSNSVTAMSNVDNLLKFRISGESTPQNRQYLLETEILLLNTNSQISDSIIIDGPVANPPEGLVPVGTLVSLSAGTGAEIYYTTNGTPPTTASNLYVSPITIVTDTTIKAIAVLNGVSSSLATYSYNLTSNPLPEATTIEITGIPETGKTLTVNYSFSSKVEPVVGQGESVINWYSTEKKKGSPNAILKLVYSSVFVEGDESSRQYVVKNTDKGSYLYVEVIPKTLNNAVGLSNWSTQDFGKISN